MSTIEATPLINSSHQAVSSPDGLHIASFHAPHLEIRQIKTLELLRTIAIPSNSNSRFLCIKWSPVGKGMGASNRFLLSDEDTTRIWDLQDTQWSAVIDNGTGGAGKVTNVEFGSDDTEVLVFSSFSAKVTVWSLWTGRSVEIRDPKFAFKGHGRNRCGRNGTFALLTRPAAQDILTLHASGTYDILKSITLPTVDAQGLKWSPDGRWIAIWDTPSTGYSVHIYTADGNLFRRYNGDYYEDGLTGLGVKSIEWSPNGDCLAIGGYERTVTLLSTRTVSYEIPALQLQGLSLINSQFSPAVQLSHFNSIKLRSGTLWQEQAASSTERFYNILMQRTSPPTALPTPGDNQIKIGISIIAFNAQGTYLATKDDSMPTTVWIWDLAKLTATAVLIQHATIKRLIWHPSNPDILMVQCIQGESILYLWNAATQQPQILSMPETRFSGKVEAQWINKDPYRKPTILFADPLGFTLAFPDGRDQPSPVLGAEVDETTHMGDQSTDSLFEILSGRKTVEDGSDPIFEDDPNPGAANETLQDTFRFRHGVSVK